MAIRYKSDILGRLKACGYSAKRLRDEKIFGEKTMQDFRKRAEIPYKTLNRLCELLGCDVGEIIEYTKDDPGDEEPAQI